MVGRQKKMVGRTKKKREKVDHIERFKKMAVADPPTEITTRGSILKKSIERVRELREKRLQESRSSSESSSDSDDSTIDELGATIYMGEELTPHQLDSQSGYEKDEVLVSEESDKSSESSNSSTSSSADDESTASSDHATTKSTSSSDAGMDTMLEAFHNGVEIKRHELNADTGKNTLVGEINQIPGEYSKETYVNPTFYSGSEAFSTFNLGDDESWFDPDRTWNASYPRKSRSRGTMITPPMTSSQPSATNTHSGYWPSKDSNSLRPRVTQTTKPALVFSEKPTASTSKLKRCSPYCQGPDVGFLPSMNYIPVQGIDAIPLRQTPKKKIRKVPRSQFINSENSRAGILRGPNFVQFKFNSSQ